VREAAGSQFEVVTLEHDDEKERCAKISGCDAVICAATPLRKHHLDAAKSLRVVHHQGVGWQDTTDWQEIKRRGLPLALTPEGTTIGVAEHTVLLMLAAAKRLSYADAELRRGRWHVNALRAVSRELYGKTIGYIGFGRIGQAVADRLKSFGCCGIYSDAAVALPAATETALGVRKGEFHDLLAASDVLTIHVPLTTETRGLIGRTRSPGSNRAPFWSTPRAGESSTRPPLRRRSNPVACWRPASTCSKRSHRTRAALCWSCPTSC